MADKEVKPTMYMIAGPNGAGKSTLYETTIKPHINAPFINADVIQKNELKNPDVKASYKAAEIAEQRRQEHLAAKKSFVSESTFSHPSKLALIQEAKDAGFRVVVYHVNVRNANLSVDRVANRVSAGGHDVPEDKIRERYERNQELIKAAAGKADRAFVYDNSALNKDASLAIAMKNGQVVRVAENVPAWARQLYAKELEPYSQSRLNPAAASYEETKAIAKRMTGEDTRVQIPAPGASYKGQVVGESALHLVQRTKDDNYIAHFKTVLEGKAQMGREVEIAYQTRQKATVKTEPERQSLPKDIAESIDKKLDAANITDPEKRAVIKAELEKQVMERMQQGQGKPAATPEKKPSRDADHGGPER